jgi:diadenosine tetraphosphatase ApaH/serine/threonine PP2A family protein phosphatase
MQLAVISDIHANLEAFEAVLADIDQLGIGDVVSLGDNVGYGADPEAVARQVRARGIPSVMGNHELALAEQDVRERLNPFAQEALRRTRALLSEETLVWAAGLPRFMVRGGMRFVHGFPPDRVSTYMFELANPEIERRMAGMEEALCFVGHTHELELASLDRTGLRRGPLEDAVLPESGRHLVNAGSVGQPRDGDPRAKYVLWDAETRRLEVRRVPYDNRMAAAKIVKAGMPEGYARRLLS